MGHFGFSNIRFVIVETNPKQSVIISDNTIVKVVPHAVEITDDKVPEVTYEDIGGLEDETKKVREMAERLLKASRNCLKGLVCSLQKGFYCTDRPEQERLCLQKQLQMSQTQSFITLTYSEITSKFVGEAEKNKGHI